MEAKPEEKKHEALKENQDEQTEVEVVKDKDTKIKNTASPFLSMSKSWHDDEVFGLPEDIKNNITDKLGFKNPSGIQSVAIPLIAKEPFANLIAQSANGSGKTGAFSIGSVLRVDRNDPSPQVLVLANTRELVN